MGRPLETGGSLRGEREGFADAIETTVEPVGALPCLDVWQEYVSTLPRSRAASAVVPSQRTSRHRTGHSGSAVPSGVLGAQALLSIQVSSGALRTVAPSRQAGLLADVPRPLVVRGLGYSS